MMDQAGASIAAYFEWLFYGLIAAIAVLWSSSSAFTGASGR